jgi:hypothetical protein
MEKNSFGIWLRWTGCWMEGSSVEVGNSSLVLEVD